MIAVGYIYLYFTVLFYFLFFSEEMGRTYSERTYHYNLVPFKEIGRFIRYHKRLGNGNRAFKYCGKCGGICSVRYISAGFFRTLPESLVYGIYSFELSLLVELLQLVTKVGSFDVDDLILNTIGGHGGFLIYLLGKRILRGDGCEKTP